MLRLQVVDPGSALARRVWVQHSALTGLQAAERHQITRPAISVHLLQNLALLPAALALEMRAPLWLRGAWALLHSPAQRSQ